MHNEARELDYKTFFESVPGLYLVLDPELHILAASDAYLSATLTRRSDIIGKHLFEVFPENPEDPSADSIRNTRASLNRVLRTRQPDVMVVQRHDVRRPETEGGGYEVRYWSPVNSPVLNPDGSLAYIIHRVENVTDFILLKQQGIEQAKLTDALREQAVRIEADLYSRSREVAEASLKLKHANEELARLNEKARELDELKNQFFANVSHELRTPLTLILGPVERQLKSPKLDDRIRQDLLIVQRNARLLHRHVNDLLDISKLDAGHMRLQYARVNLTSLARRVASHFEVLAADRNIRFDVRTPPSLPAEVDTEKMERALFNLLSNAFKFTPQGGAVTLSTEESSGHALFTVQDTGPGVPEHLREVIFERFRQGEGGVARLHGGTGLGLAIVREFVSLHHGAVKVSEAQGGGAVFSVDIPLAAPPGTEVAEAAAAKETPSADYAPGELQLQPPPAASLNQPDAEGTARILIVEDNPDMNAFLADILGQHYRVSRAFGGKQGLNKAIEDPPDLILADIMMPEMSGDRMVEQMRLYRILDDVPVIVLTAKADDELRIKFLQHGVQDYIHKPFSAEELLARVKGLLTEHKRNARRLRQSETRYRILFESIDEGFCLIEVLFDQDGKPDGYRFLEANPAFERQTGLKAAMGKRMKELRPHHEQHWFDRYGRIALTGEPERFTMEAKQLNKWYDVYAFRIGPPKECTVAVLFNDITKRKQMEQSIRRLNQTLEQKAAERTMLAETRAKQLQSLAIELIETEERERRKFSHMLHEDLQQMLAAAKMRLQTLSDAMLEKGLVEVVLLLKESIEKSRRLSHELSPSVLHHSGLVGALRWLCERMGEQFDLKVALEVSTEPLLENEALKRFLFRSVQELLFNIVKHSGVHRARIVLSDSAQKIMVKVSDEGRGFDPDTLNEVGKGFGLITIRERASYIGGNLSIDSAPGKGSRFTLTIPIPEPKADGAAHRLLSPQVKVRSTEASEATAHMKTRVLFADDHHVMRKGLVNLLNSQPNIEVVGEAANGQEALDQARHLKPDVVVMDISMPVMNGIEATRRIKAEMPEVRVIGLSMHQDEQIARTMSLSGAEAFMLKSTSPNELLKAIYGGRGLLH